MTADWINHEAEFIKAEEEKAKERENEAKIVGDLTRDSWSNFKIDLQKQIGEFNLNETIQHRYQRKLDFKDDGWLTVQINSDVYPAVYMTVNLNNMSVEIKWTTVTPTNLDKWSQNPSSNKKYRREHKDKESLAIIKGPENSLYVDGIHGRQTFDNLPEYILRKFLIEPTKFPRRF